MIVRFLLLAGIVYLFFRVRKRWKNAGRTDRVGGRPSGGPEGIDDIMVKDPICNVYIPRREALHIRHKGEDIYFCGEACRDAFFRQNS